ncbi:DUF945 family protein [Ectothiorhodospira lacustris]|uniref:DUF945 family protein n=1 Tax=Ectothiorhodospira lacustris TaxID=2899127 RepID=UPI001EE83CA2|nr:DUF945 family protein [Ectothiorhodospira lacustris]MCG5522464.1 YdgA family protein [Ectothiorhodospira lacustris]
MVALLLGASLLGLNQWVHKAAADRIEASLEHLGQIDSTQPGLHLLWADYDRKQGFIRYRLRFIPAPDSPLYPLLTERQETELPYLELSGNAEVTTHGLPGLLGKIADVEGQLLLSDTWRQVLPDYQGEDWAHYDIEFHTRHQHRVSIHGEGYQGRIMNALGQRQGEADWSAWRLVGHWRQDGRLDRLSLDLPRAWIKVQDENLELLLESLEFVLEDALVEEGILTQAQSETRITRWRLEDRHDSLEMRDLKLHWHNQREADRLKSDVILAWGPLILDGSKLLESGQVSMGSDVSFSGLVELRAMTDSGTSEDAAAREAGLHALLSRGAMIAVDTLSLQHAEAGSFEGRLTLGLKKNPALDLSRGLAGLEALHGSAGVQVQPALIKALMRSYLLEQFPGAEGPHLDRLVEQQWLEWSFLIRMMPFVTHWDDDLIRMALELDAGMLSVDGRQVMNLQEILRLF